MTTEKELAGQIAVVSGGSGEIGRAIIRASQQADACDVSLDIAPPCEDGIPWLSCDVRDDSSVATVLFLCGPGGSRITGQILRVDAGQYLGGS